MAKYPYLANADILKYIDNLTIQTQYIRIVVLNQEDLPLKNIEGRSKSGSISINNASLIRRTGSLSIITDAEKDLSEEEQMHTVTNIKSLLSMNKRCSIEVGIENSGFEYQQYKIFWIPLGVYLINNATVSYNNQGISITLKLGDKMNLLNGEMGGTIQTATTHSPIYETDSNGNYTLRPVRYYNMIESMIEMFGELSRNQFAINDVPLMQENIVRWVGDEPMWINFATKQYAVQPNSPDVGYTKYEYGQDVGKILTDFTYPVKDEFTTSPGESVSQALERVKNTLGNYEVFFDIDGVLWFRQIKDYLNQGSVFDDLTQAINDKYFINTGSTKATYHFDDAKLITAYNNNPQYSKIKNDIVVWGKQPDTDIAIRYHLIFKKKPLVAEYNYWQVEYENKLDNLTGETRYFIKTARLRESAAGADLTVGNNWRLKLYLEAIALSKNETASSIPNKGFTLSNQFREELKAWFPIVYDLNPDAEVETEDKRWTDRWGKLYFLDIIDPRDLTSIQVSQFAVEEIGWRTKTINDNNVNCLFSSRGNDFFENAILFKNIDDYLKSIDKHWDKIVGIEPKRPSLLYKPSSPIEPKFNPNSDMPIKPVWEEGEWKPKDSPYLQELEESESYDGDEFLTSKYINDMDLYNRREELWKDYLEEKSKYEDKLSIYKETYEKRWKEAAGEDYDALEDEEEESWYNSDLLYLKEDEKYKEQMLAYNGLVSEYNKLAENKLKELNESLKNSVKNEMYLLKEHFDKLAIGTIENPAIDVMRSALHEYLSFSNNITISTMPIYHLDVNQRIRVESDEADIHGDYIINTISLPLGITGTMSINARKAVERI